MKLDALIFRLNHKCVVCDSSPLFHLKLIPMQNVTEFNGSIRITYHDDKSMIIITFFSLIDVNWIFNISLNRQSYERVNFCHSLVNIYRFMLFWPYLFSFGKTIRIVFLCLPFFVCSTVYFKFVLYVRCGWIGQFGCRCRRVILLLKRVNTAQAN